MDRIHPGPDGSRLIVRRRGGLTIEINAQPIRDAATAEIRTMADQSWMTHDHVPQPAPAETHPETVLWTLTKGERRASAILRRLPDGRELRCLVDGELQQSQLYRVAPALDLYQRAEDWRQQFLAVGWTDAPA